MIGHHNHIVDLQADNQGKPAGFVHSFDVGSAVDGPGIRFTLFVSGCQFHCLYCHNPDTWHIHSGKLWSIDDVIEEIGKYSHFLNLSGGLTISGGEPLFQAYFVNEIFRLVKQKFSLHTALDTQGHLAQYLADDWFDNVDLILLDIKHIDPVKHLQITGQALQPTLDFANRLSALGKKMWIRYVLVPGYTDDPFDIKHLGDFVSNLQGVERVEIMPFHKMGEHKWSELDISYQLANVSTPSNEEIEVVKKILKDQGHTVY